MVKRNTFTGARPCPANRASALAAALAGVFFCTSAWALDLSQAYQAALEQDASLRATQAATAARRERLPQARSQLLPSLSFRAVRNRNALESTTPSFFQRNPVTTQTDYHSRSETLTLKQPLFRIQELASYHQAIAQVDNAEATLAQEVQDAAVRVSGAYFEALLTAEQLALVLAQKVTYTHQLDAARKRFAAGLGIRTDIDEAQAALDLNVAQELEARQNVDFARRQLQTLVNQPIDMLAPLDAEKMARLAPASHRLEDWIARAEASNPEIRSLMAQVEAARYEVAKAQAGHTPTLDAVAQWSRSKSETVTSVNSRYVNRSIGLQLNVPIFSGGYVNSTVRQALAEQERAEQALEATRRDLGVRVHREFRGVSEGVLKIKALEQAVRSSEQVVLSNRRSFEAGSRTLLDILNAEQKTASARRDLAQARFFYLISRVRLHALTGSATTEVIDEINACLASPSGGAALRGSS